MAASYNNLEIPGAGIMEKEGFLRKRRNVEYGIRKDGYSL